MSDNNIFYGLVAIIVMMMFITFSSLGNTDDSIDTKFNVMNTTPDNYNVTISYEIKNLNLSNEEFKNISNDLYDLINYKITITNSSNIIYERQIIYDLVDNEYNLYNNSINIVITNIEFQKINK